MCTWLSYNGDAMSDLRKAAEMALESWGFFFSQAHPEIVGLMYGNDWAKIAKERTEALRQALAMERFSEISQEIEQELKTPSWEKLSDEEIKEIEILYYHDKLYDIADLCRLIEKRLMKKNLGGTNV